MSFSSGMHIHLYTEKKDGAKTVPFGNRFEKWCPFSKNGTKTVPLWQSAPPTNQCPFAKGHQNSATKGTVLWTIKRCANFSQCSLSNSTELYKTKCLISMVCTHDCVRYTISGFPISDVVINFFKDD